MSESMIEKVARAICLTKERDPDRRMPTSINPPDGRPVWTAYEWQARAAIEAMLPFIAQGLIKFSGDIIPPDGKDYLIFPRPNPPSPEITHE